MIIQELHKIQHRCGYLPAAELKLLAQRIETPLYRLQEVASFFPHFRLHPPPTVEVHVCHDMACHLRGSAGLCQELREKLATPDGKVVVEFASCLGRCDRAPAAMVNETVFVQRSAAELIEIARRIGRGEKVPADGDQAYSRQKPIDWQIDCYGGVPTYAAVKQFVEGDQGDRLIAELKTSELAGMGGAGVPAHKKWNDVWRARGDRKYIVCNGDESEPGTFKDRELLLRTPHLVLEGVILAGLLTGATQGYIYIRHEYHEAIEATRQAIAAAESLGACGNRIFGSERSFPVEVFVSPGGYICGEQSALVEAIQDNRAQPRNKPPELQTNGLHDKPTLVSNVETFAWAPSIFLNGGQWYADSGVNGCKGLRFFSISGDVARPGVFEVRDGITLRELFDLAGGMAPGRKLKGFAPSGPSGGFLPARIPISTLQRRWDTALPLASVNRLLRRPAETALPADLAAEFKGFEIDLLDLELDLGRFRALGLMLGAGMVVYGDQADMVDEALNCVEFFRSESCGKCVPCRVGSEKLVGITRNLRDHKYNAEQFANVRQDIDELSRAMVVTSICGLGPSAPAPITSVARYFAGDVQPYLTGRPAP